jgi:hypothetical protein
MKNLYRLLSICLFAAIVSCGSDEEPSIDCNTPDAAFQAAFLDYFQIGLAYGLDPSSANCIALKAAINIVVPQLERYASCDQETADSVTEAKNQLTQLTC